MSNIKSFKANDGITLKYLDTNDDSSTSKEKPFLILIHGFTGSRKVWKRNIPDFAQKYRVIVPDLRGHGESDKCRHGYHVSRLAMDLRELMVHLVGPNIAKDSFRAIGGSLGCAILWSYAELFTTEAFSHMAFVDQSPLQNEALDWDKRFCNRGMNCERAVVELKEQLERDAEIVYGGTVAACLSYRSHPSDTDVPGSQKEIEDTKFFIDEAKRGDPTWFGKLMANHTSLDWRDSIKANFGPGSGSKTKVMVIASTRSGCFPAAGPLKVVEFVNGDSEIRTKTTAHATGVAVDWGGHWCYWEDPEKFYGIAVAFLEPGSL